MDINWLPWKSLSLESSVLVAGTLEFIVILSKCKVMIILFDAHACKVIH